MSDLVKRVCTIATGNYRAGHGFGPLLVLDGPNGSAVLRYDATDHHAPSRDRARMMALALRADRCVFAVESTLCFSGRAALQVVVLLTKGREGCHIILFAPLLIAGHVEMSRVRTRMAGPVSVDVLDRFIHDVLPRSAQASEVDQAWVYLEEMGVTIARDSRQLH